MDRRHNLYKYHERAIEVMTGNDRKGSELQSLLQSLERRCVQDVEVFLDNFGPDSVPEAEDLFKDIIESEIKFYK